jgi:hypothetical protein
MSRWFTFAAVLLSVAGQPVKGQSAPPLLVIDARGVSHAVTPADLAALPRYSLSVDAHHVRGRYTGVALSDLLARVGVPLGDSLRGARLSTYAMVEGADGYRALFALAELDPSFVSHRVMLADEREGAPLAARDGPWQVIAPGDRRPARWVRQVVRLRVVQVPAP